MAADVPEVVQTRLVAVVADLLGRLDADKVPGPLRQIARFTPPKRRRLGAAPIGHVLEQDADFRAALAELVRAAEPKLVQAVEDGDVEAPEDLLDAAAAACLVRPDGWPDYVARATKEWAESKPPTADTHEVRRLRAEIADLKAHGRAETARTRQAVAAAIADAEDRVTVARREARERLRQARDAEQERDELRVERTEQRRRFDATQTGQEAEVRRLRARVAELERIVETNRRDARTERDLDDARLWLLTETVVQAAAGLRRELSLAPPSLAPADTVAATSGDVARHAVTDAGALDRLLTLPNVHLIVDGYNVTIGGYGERTLADQRARLIGGLAGVAARSGAEVTVAFDGRTRPAVQPAVPRGVRVLFSQGEIADDLIRRLVAAEPPGRPVVVVTSDQQVVTDVTRAGAYAAPSAVLLALLG